MKLDFYQARPRFHLNIKIILFAIIIGRVFNSIASIKQLDTHIPTN